MIDVVNFTNWDGTTTRNRVFSVAPTSLEDIQDIVKMMQMVRIRGHCVGSAYSYSDVFPDEDTLLIDMSRMTTRFDGDPFELDMVILYRYL
jgi:FAD/FMN-containing dehydrogenase